MSIEIKEVTTLALRKEFIRFGDELYAGNPYYVPALVVDEMNYYDRSKNKNYVFCEDISYLAYQDGKVVGRITGLINHAYNEKKGLKQLRFHHFDMIDDVEVSKALLNAIAKWGQAKGMNEFNGPIGMTDFDKQGMLLDGYDLDSMMITIYNYPYYVEHMKTLGFVKDVDWREYRVYLPKEVDPRIARIAETVAKKRGFRLLKFKNKKEMMPYLVQAFEVYNQAFAPLHGVVELQMDQINMYIDQYIGMLNFRYIQLVVNDKDEVIGFAALVPSLSNAMRKAKGKLFPFGWYHVLKALKHPKILDMFFVAVKPEYQGMGVNALMMLDATRCANEDGVLFAETGPELEDNTLVQGQWDNYEHEIVRHRRCYSRPLEELD
jgi:GNAT superfamily N-acetyltransferase